MSSCKPVRLDIIFHLPVNVCSKSLREQWRSGRGDTSRDFRHVRAPRSMHLRLLSLPSYDLFWPIRRLLSTLVGGGLNLGERWDIVKSTDVYVCVVLNFIIQLTVNDVYFWPTMPFNQILLHAVVVGVLPFKSSSGSGN